MTFFFVTVMMACVGWQDWCKQSKNSFYTQCTNFYTTSRLSLWNLR